ncbi:permease of the drug/metabolite transporter (DMT) superfamily [Candidatus Blochmanniella floridana]|uniref:Permease of the drug/metabolite transporter (DMT) superfamily n=1 Tax=Blochmanniella floridana TaxID=203907 RepID=Q7VRB2_BLOFL|nr:permease of the drug/metabolite transporter (DMT) superfamily [Candidatus Blochmannia floridanus]
MILGIFYAIISGLLWGLIFIGPLLIPEYPGIFQASGRYIAFGLISLLLSWYDRKHLFQLLLQDWLEAIKLVIAGHLMYYTCLVGAIQRIGVPISTAIIGTLPVMITISSQFFLSDKKNLFGHALSKKSVLISILLISVGLLCINISELRADCFIYNIVEYLVGIAFAIISVLCWTWYAMRNMYWLKTHPNNKPITWANAQGIVTLPLSFITYFMICIYSFYIQNEFTLPLGPRPIFFIVLMIIIGFCCSWLGTFFWNEASRRLPITLMGPLIVFETIAGLIYAFIYRKSWPSSLILIGVLLLISGVLYIVYTQNSCHQRN